MAFDLDSFIAGINREVESYKDSMGGNGRGNRLSKIHANRTEYQGTITFLPVYSKGIDNFFLSLSRVYEYFGHTSLLDKVDKAWFKVLPKSLYGKLTPEQSKLYDLTAGLCEELRKSKKLSFKEFRTRNYSLFPCICQSIKSASTGKLVEDFNDRPSLIIYPSFGPIEAMSTAMNNKIDALKGNRDWVVGIFSPTGTGYQGVMQMSFTKSSGPGYVCSASFEMNTTLSPVVDPAMELDADTKALFDDILASFLGWGYDSENGSYFNEQYFRELKDQLLIVTGKQDRAAAERPIAENRNGEAPAAAEAEESGSDGDLPF